MCSTPAVYTVKNMSLIYNIWLLLTILYNYVVKLYSRWLVEKELGIQLTKDQVVQHIDENPFNDVISNLKVVDQKIHKQNHFTKTKTKVHCEVCTKEIYRNINNSTRGTYFFCSRSCRGKFGRHEQLRRNS